MNKGRTSFWKQIIIFNLPAFFIAALAMLICLLQLFYFKAPSVPKFIPILILIGAAWFSIGSVLFSYYIYDRSDLYKFEWLKKYLSNGGTLFNIYSGYSEGGHLLNENIIGGRILHMDFFDPKVSVTASIKKAQSISKPLRSLSITPYNIPLDQKASVILFMQSLHELRPEDLKVTMLTTAAKHLGPSGRIIIAEHLCDWRNFLIYGPGAFHFFGENHWQNVINRSGLTEEKSFRITPFVKIFILKA